MVQWRTFAAALAVVGIFVICASVVWLIRYVRGGLGDFARARTAEKRSAAASIEKLRMKALIVCRNPEIIAVFSQLFREICIQLHRCDSERQTFALLTSQKYEAMVLDFDDLLGCEEIAMGVRSIRSNQDIAIFAIASSDQRKAAALTSGSTFLIQQPLVPSQIRSVLHSVFGRMLGSSQVYFRLNAEIPVLLERAGGAALHCKTLNLSQSGMAVDAPTYFLLGEKLRLEFVIPKTDRVMRAEAVVIWHDDHGKAGIRFDCPSDSMKACYCAWLQDEFFTQLASVRVASEGKTV